MKKAKATTRHLKKDEVWSCRFIWFGCFAVLLPVALLARLSGWRWQPWPLAADGRRSVLREARLMTGTIVGTVFSV